MFFKNHTIHIENQLTNKVIFSCDTLYWTNYAKYLLKSCDDLGINAHVHIVGNNLDFIQNEVKSFVLNLNNQHSLSSEAISEDLLEYPRVTYYFIARYYATKYLFENTPLNEAIILDADVILNNIITFPFDKDIGIYYKPHKPSPFKQVWGNLFMIKKSKSWFIDSVLSRFENNYQTIDWAWVHTLKGKKRVQNFSGQDQICIAEEIDKVCNDPGFFNLKNTNYFEHSIYTLTGKRDNPQVIAMLKDRFGF